MTKEFWKALLNRAIHAVWETAVSTLPATIVITPAMIEHFDWEQAKGIFYIFVAWALTSVFAGVLSAIKSAKVGMPEVGYAEHIHMSKEEPEDSWVDEYEVFDYGDEIGIEEGDYDGKE